MRLIELAALSTAALAAVTGGSLFAFSTLVMPSLQRLPASQAVSAMQAINEVAPRSVFVLPLLASAAASVVVMLLALARRDVDGLPRALMLAGAVCGIAAFVVTGVGNVPLNNRLALADTSGSGAAQAWADFAGPWTALNTLRTVLALASAALLVAAVLAGARGVATARAGGSAAALVEQS